MWSRICWIESKISPFSLGAMPTEGSSSSNSSGRPISAHGTGAAHHPRVGLLVDGEDGERITQIGVFLLTHAVHRRASLVGHLGSRIGRCGHARLRTVRTHDGVHRRAHSPVALLRVTRDRRELAQLLVGELQLRAMCEEHAGEATAGRHWAAHHARATGPHLTAVRAGGRRSHSPPAGRFATRLRWRTLARCRSGLLRHRRGAGGEDAECQ